MSLYIVRDSSGRQWLCPSRPILVGRGDDPSRHWEVEVSWKPGDDEHDDEHFDVKCLGSRCIPLSKADGLDECAFEGKGAWKVYRVGVVLG